MTARRLLIAATASVVAAATPVTVAAGAKTGRKSSGPMSHLRFWENTRATAICGLERPRPHKKPTVVLCSSHGIPRPKHTRKGGTAYVQITRKGKPKLLLATYFLWVTDRQMTLTNGTTWSSAGVTCKVGATVRCSNKSRHGFRIGNNKYKSF